MLPGSLTGITYYLQPELYRLLDTQVTIIEYLLRLKHVKACTIHKSIVLPSGVGGRSRSDILFGRSRVRGSLVVRVIQQYKKQLLHVRT